MYRVGAFFRVSRQQGRRTGKSRFFVFPLNRKHKKIKERINNLNPKRFLGDGPLSILPRLGLWGPPTPARVPWYKGPPYLAKSFFFPFYFTKFVCLSKSKSDLLC